MQKSERINIANYIFPWNDLNPIFLSIDDSLFLPLFSTIEKLDELMKRFGITTYRIKKIDDSREFLESLMENATKVKLLVDIEWTDKGSIKFKEIIYD